MKIKYQPKLKAKYYQKSGIKRMLTENTINADEQGLGKTKQACDVAGILFEQRKIQLAILICKGSLRKTLCDEFQKNAPQLVSRCIDGTPKERLSAYNTPSAHVLMLSFETLVSDKQLIGDLIKNNSTYVIVDESHYLKNHKSSRTKAALEVLRNAYKIDLLSGTMAPNKAEDVFTQLKLCGKDVGDDIKDFRKRFKSLDVLKEVIGDSMIRRKKSELTSEKLPPKAIKVLNVPLGGEQLRLYDKARDDVVVSLKNNPNKKISVDSLLAKMVRLLQICSDPINLFSDFSDDTTKIKCLDELIGKMLKSPNRKIILWTHHRKTLDKLLLRYKHFNTTTIHGGLSKKERNHNSFVFQNDPHIRIMLATPQSAREGFTFTKADVAIFFDRDFSLLNWQQAQDRIHRITQTKEAKIMVIKAGGTIEDKVDELLNRKASVQRYLLGDSDECLPRTVSTKEALAWFS